MIEADCDHAYVTFQGKELLLDEFSRLVLEDTFFNLVASHRPGDASQSSDEHSSTSMSWFEGWKNSMARGRVRKPPVNEIPSG